MLRITAETMGALFDQIREAVAADRYAVGLHASDRLRERGILEWQVASGLPHAKLIKERPRDRPNPSVVVEQVLADGTSVIAVWAWLKADAGAILVTVHFDDE